jgi:membrane-bound inhibitor of C-type lysozyme
MRLIEIESDPTANAGEADEPQDRASSADTTFECPDLGSFAIRFLGPETLELKLSGRTHVLERQRTASGARYVGDDIDFWNRGDEAMLTIDGREYRCTKRA